MHALHKVLMFCHVPHLRSESGVSNWSEMSKTSSSYQPSEQERLQQGAFSNTNPEQWVKVGLWCAWCAVLRLGCVCVKIMVCVEERNLPSELLSRPPRWRPSQITTRGLETAQQWDGNLKRGRITAPSTPTIMLYQNLLDHNARTHTHTHRPGLSHRTCSGF